MARDLGDGLNAQLGFQRTQESHEVHVKRREPVPQLNDVQAPLPPFDLANSPLPSAQPQSQISLSKALGLALTSKQVEEDFVVAAVQSLGHGNLSACTLDQSGPYSESECMPKQ